MMLRACLLVLVSATTMVTAAERVEKIGIGDKVPDFSIKALNGKEYKFSELQKNEKLTSSGVTMFTFWCSFCGSCRKVEFPLNKLAAKYKGKAMIVALDSSFGESAEDVMAFQKEKRLTMPIALDPSGDVADIFGAKMTTTTVIIDAEGKLRYFGQFAHGRELMAETALQSILAGRQPRHTQTKEHG